MYIVTTRVIGKVISLIDCQLSMIFDFLGPKSNQVTLSSQVRHMWTRVISSIDYHSKINKRQILCFSCFVQFEFIRISKHPQCSITRVIQIMEKNIERNIQRLYIRICLHF